MILNLQQHEANYFGQFTKNGVIIDTCVLRVLIDGLFDIQVSGKPNQDFEDLMDFLDLIKMKNAWSRFYITPHVLTETCRQFRDKYRKWDNLKDLLGLVIPVMNSMQEANSAKKEDILNSIELSNPIIDIGDISICLVADDFIKKQMKIAFLSVDSRLNAQFSSSKEVLAMDFRQNILNFIG